MTANRGQVGATTAGDLVEVHSLDAFSFAVPDLETATEFQRAFGLAVTERDGALEIRTEGLGLNGIWLRDFEGTLVELRVAAKSSPDEKAHGMMNSSPAGVAAAADRRRLDRSLNPARRGQRRDTNDFRTGMEFR